MLKNLISTFFTRSTVALLNLAILLVSTRQLGSGNVGQVSLLIVNIAVVQIINEIYTGYALVHYIPKFSLRRLYSTGLLWALVSTGLINLIFLLFSVGLREFWLHGLILSFTITLHSFHCVILLAKQKIKAYNFLMLFQPLVLLLILSTGIFVLGNKTVDSYILALYASYCGSAVVSASQVTKLFKADTNKAADFSIVSVLRNGFINQLGNLAHMLSNRYNYYLIGSTALLGLYASATSLVESVWIIGGSIAPIILTHIANQKDVANNSRITFLLSKASFLLSALCIVVIIILPPGFFTWLLGKDFSGTKTVMLYLSPGVLCISFSTVISHYFSGLGQQRVQLLANSAGLLTAIGTSWFFIPRYGLVGACYSASLSYFVAALVLVIVFMQQNQFRFAALFSLRKELKLLRNKVD